MEVLELSMYTVNYYAYLNTLEYDKGAEYHVLSKDIAHNYFMTSLVHGCAQSNIVHQRWSKDQRQ
jgi:hypothetical protein